MSRLTIGVTIALALLPLGALAADLPSLVFEAPPRFAPLATRLAHLNPQAVRAAMALVGLERPPAPIPVILAPDDSELARAAPAWVSGYALVPSGRIVLFPERQVAYPHGSLEGLLLHELTHVFVMWTSGGHSGPRWFEEGLAMVASHEHTLEDHLWGVWFGLTNTPIRLTEIDDLFEQGRPAVQQAYLLAERLVRYLMETHGTEIPRRILQERARGVSFGQAVERVTGGSVRQLERDFWTQHTAWSRWVPLATSSAILWTAIVLLTWLAWRAQRRRAATVKQQWEEEDEER